MHQPFVGNRRGAYILFCKCSHYCLVPRTCCAPATACTLLMHYLCGASCHCFFLSDAMPDSRGWYRRNGAWEWRWGVDCLFIQVHSFLSFFLFFLGTGVETFIHYRRRPCVRVRCYRLYLEHIVRRVLAWPRSTEAMLSYRQRDTARKRMFAVNSLWTKNGMPAEVVELMQIYGSHVSLLYISFCLLFFCAQVCSSSEL